MSKSPEPRLDSPSLDKDNEVADTNGNGVENDSPAPEEAADDSVAADNLLADLSDDESVLSDVDEAQFENFDPENLAIEDRPALAIDEENLKLVGRHKRRRTEEEESQRKKKKKEGRREKRSHRKKHDSDDFSGGEEVEGKRHRKSKDRERSSRKPVEEVNEEDLDPATRRRRALDRMMDEALKKPTKRRMRKADGIDLADLADAEIEDVRKRMTDAARLDSIARKENRPAMHKLKMLPEVVSLLNRNQYVNSLIDPEINLLEAVKFFLEPLDDGSLPAYNIQRDLMAALARLPINKETLIASGIGKVIVFYTKSKRPEIAIKRQAEKLLAEWTRPILQRSDDYSKRVYEEVDYDPRRLTERSQQVSAQATAAEARARALLPPRLANRARVESSHTTYTVVPRSTAVAESKFARPLGASGEDRFRRMKARQIAASKGSRKAVIKAGTIGGVLGLVGGLAGVLAGSKRYAGVRNLTLPMKAFLVSSSGTFTGIIAADHGSRTFDVRQEHGFLQEREARLREEELAQMSTMDRVVAFARREKYKIVGITWVASILGSFALVSRNPYLTGQQKLVQARVYAQGLTLAVLVASAGFEISDSRQGKGIVDAVKKKQAFSKATADDDLWKDMVDAEEHRMEEKKKGTPSGKPSN
ncbi:Transcription factor iws1 [Myotisia sp. PD_48]|nr:Transcription factor iws1 [Myotisia sp. PD_48]